MNETPHWQEWKSTTIGILTVLFSVVVLFYPKFTVDNQKVVLDGVSSLFDNSAAILGIITGLITVFKASFGKK